MNFGIILILLKFILAEITVSLSEIDGEVLQFEFCGVFSETILLLTDAFSLYRSINSGRTYYRLTDLFASAVSVGSSTLVNFQINPADADIVFFKGVSSVYWISEDCGNTVTSYEFLGEILEFQFHPSVRN